MIVGSADGSGCWYNLHGQWLVQHTWSMVGTTYMVNGWYNIYVQWLVQHTWSMVVILTWSMVGTTYMYMFSGWYNIPGQWLLHLHGQWLVQNTWSMVGTTHMMKSKMASNRMIYMPLNDIGQWCCLLLPVMTGCWPEMSDDYHTDASL